MNNYDGAFREKSSSDILKNISFCIPQKKRRFEKTSGYINDRISTFRRSFLFKKSLEGTRLNYAGPIRRFVFPALGKQVRVCNSSQSHTHSHPPAITMLSPR